MFRASSAHLQEDTVVYMQHVVLSLSMRVPGGLSAHSLSENWLEGEGCWWVSLTTTKPLPQKMKIFFFPLELWNRYVFILRHSVDFLRSHTFLALQKTVCRNLNVSILSSFFNMRSCFAQNAVCSNFKRYPMLDSFFSLSSCLSQNTVCSNLRQYWCWTVLFSTRT